MLEDKLLVWKFKCGSGEALERIYEKYEKYLITVATGLLNNTHAAEDALHDFFIGFVKSADTVKLNGSLKAYMATCVANIARNKLKRKKLEPASLDDETEFDSPEYEPEMRAIQTEQALELNQALSQLPFEQKEVIVLHIHGSMKFTQIAKLRGTSVNTIRSRYRYGLEKLRSILTSEVRK